MTDTPQPLIARPAFAGSLWIEPTVAGSGVRVADRDGVGVATLIERKSAEGALSRRIDEVFGIELPRGPRRAFARDVAFAGIGPGTWLAIREGAGNAFARSLKDAIGNLASVSDQTDGYGVLRLCGPKLRDTLCKLIPIDVHPQSFKIGDVVVTCAAHVGVTLWRLDDQPDGSLVIDIAVPRSMATSLWGAFVASAIEFGVGAGPVVSTAIAR
jgi:heterotetrameric sarcosine oxidase gamma subunit